MFCRFKSRVVGTLGDGRSSAHKRENREQMFLFS
jgi:hypothetical protein